MLRDAREALRVREPHDVRGLDDAQRLVLPIRDGCGGSNDTCRAYEEMTGGRRRACALASSSSAGPSRLGEEEFGAEEMLVFLSRQ